MESMVCETVQQEKKQTVIIELEITVGEDRTRYGTAELLQHYLERSPDVKVIEIKVYERTPRIE